jgi:hypothetical protein
MSMFGSISSLLQDRTLLRAIERAVAARGTRGDTMIAHISPAEAAMLRRAGGVGTRNPRTGLLQFYPGADEGGPGSGFGSGHVATGNSGFGPAGDGARSPGGYGRAGDPNNQGGRPGDGGLAYRINNPPPVAPPPPSPPASTSNMPPAQPVATAPMMSTTATTDLTGGAFGALPSWATTPYQVGMAPASYPTPGVNTSVGLPMTLDRESNGAAASPGHTIERPLGAVPIGRSGYSLPSQAMAAILAAMSGQGQPGFMGTRPQLQPITQNGWRPVAMPSLSPAGRSAGAPATRKFVSPRW